MANNQQPTVRLSFGPATRPPQATPTPPSPPSDSYYVFAENRSFGPVPSATIRQWIAEKRISGETMAQQVGTNEWKRIAGMPEFAGQVSLPTPSSANPSSDSYYLLADEHQYGPASKESIINLIVEFTRRKPMPNVIRLKRTGTNDWKCVADFPEFSSTVEFKFACYHCGEYIEKARCPHCGEDNIVPPLPKIWPILSRSICGVKLGEPLDTILPKIQKWKRKSFCGERVSFSGLPALDGNPNIYQMHFRLSYYGLVEHIRLSFKKEIFLHDIEDLLIHEYGQPKERYEHNGKNTAWNCLVDGQKLSIYLKENCVEKEEPSLVFPCEYEMTLDYFYDELTAETRKMETEFSKPQQESYYKEKRASEVIQLKTKFQNL